MIDRRKLFSGLLAAPVIIRTPGLLMRIKPVDEYDLWLSTLRENNVQPAIIKQLEDWKTEYNLHNYFREMDVFLRNRSLI